MYQLIAIREGWTFFLVYSSGAWIWVKKKITVVLHDYKYLTKILDPVHQEALYFLNTFMAVGKSRKGRTVLPYRGRVSTC